jgi:hypothetical protein
LTAFELQEVPTKPVDAPAGPISPDPSWSPLECWIWEKLQAGELANVDDYEDDNGTLPPADPKKPEDWQDGRRRLASRFLGDVLLREPYRSRLHRKGVRIEGAWFNEAIDLSMAQLARGLWLDRCRFEKAADLQYLRTSAFVSLVSSAFTAQVDLQSASIDASLIMRGAEFNAVVLLGARVAGQVSLIGAKVSGKLDMNSADIGQGLLMHSYRSLSEQRAEFNDVILLGAKVGGQVSLIGAKVSGKLDMNSADIGQGLVMRSDRSVSEYRAEFNDVVLSSAKVGGQVSVIGAKISGTLDMNAADIGQSLLMRSDRSVSERRESLFMRSEASARAEFEDGVNLIFAEIGRNLDVRGAVLSSRLDLTGTRIGGELRLASRSWPPRWHHGGMLVLRNTSVDAIQDTVEDGVWPPVLDLDGFTYRRFGGLGAAAEGRGSQWFIDWLARDEPYTPQPYQQCAQVLREMGHPDMANDVLYAGREPERREFWRRSKWRWFGLSLLKCTIGYGYGLRYCRSLWWVLVLVAVGTLVLLGSDVPPPLAGPIDWATAGGTEIFNYLAALAFYSFDLLLPIIQLYEPHYQIVLHGAAEYYFALHKLMGYVLASFLLAGLSGLTK